MHTGVKSFGWLNSTPHESPSQSWKLILPWVVSAVKSGAVSPRRTVMSVPSCGVEVWCAVRVNSSPIPDYSGQESSAADLVDM